MCLSLAILTLGACAARAQPAPQGTGIPDAEAAQGSVPRAGAARSPQRAPPTVPAQKSLPPLEQAALPASPTEPTLSAAAPGAIEQQRFIQSVRDAYQEAARLLSAGDQSAFERFRWIVGAVRAFDKGQALFVQRPDGYWAYRQDELTEHYAIAAFRFAAWIAERLATQQDFSGSTRITVGQIVADEVVIRLVSS